MGTRGVIAVFTNETEKYWRGVFHHYDSNPRGLGRALYRAYNGYFKQDIYKMLDYLLFHRAGWASIVNKDFSKSPGYQDHSEAPNILDGEKEYIAWHKERNQPQCFCHGARNDEPMPFITKKGYDWGAEWAYVLSHRNPVMYIFCQRSLVESLEERGVYPAPTDMDTLWRYVGVVRLDKPEPDWWQFEGMRLPFSEIETEEEYEHALTMIDEQELMGAPPNSPKENLLERLTKLIEAYEEEHYLIEEV